jgi:iron-sulfur cluster repair protein YtfE (RIC family)
MNTPKPIKRDTALQPLSREHHSALLFCMKIKTGFSKGVSAEKIKANADRFFKNHLVPHFETEEKFLFPILGNENKLVKQALEEHQLIVKLFADTLNIETSLKQIPTVLEKHIRFEERIMFNEIQQAATQEQLEIIKQVHPEESCADNPDDQF